MRGLWKMNCPVSRSEENEKGKQITFTTGFIAWKRQLVEVEERRHGQSFGLRDVNRSQISFC